MSESKEITKWIGCNSCNRETEHLRVSEYKRGGVDNLEDQEGNYFQVEYWDKAEVWECRGCKELVAEFSSYNGFEVTPVDSGFERIFLPERSINHLHPKSYKKIPSQLDKLYREIVMCYNRKCDILCCIGLRALLEGIFAEKQIKGRTLEMKVNSALFIPDNIRTNLHAYRFLGNKAAHSLIIPKNREDILLAISVIEDVLNISFELDYKSTMIYKKFRAIRHNRP